MANPNGRPITPLHLRFWDKVAKSENCWEWTGSLDKDGYGVISYGPDKRKAHRVSYEISIAPIPDGLYVLHECDNPKCVRPEHLFVGTNADNLRDMAAKGRARNKWYGKNECLNGHELNEDNTYERGGKRRCKPCAAIRNARYYQEKKSRV